MSWWFLPWLLTLGTATKEAFATLKEIPSSTTALSAQTVNIHSTEATASINANKAPCINHVLWPFINVNNIKLALTLNFPSSQALARSLSAPDCDELSSGNDCNDDEDDEDDTDNSNNVAANRRNGRYSQHHQHQHRYRHRVAPTYNNGRLMSINTTLDDDVFEDTSASNNGQQQSLPLSRLSSYSKSLVGEYRMSTYVHITYAGGRALSNLSPLAYDEWGYAREEEGGLWIIDEGHQRAHLRTPARL